MRKKFNTTGLCMPEKHYMADISEHLHKIKEYVKRVKELFYYSGIPYKEQTEYFIYESQNKTVDDPYSVFRNKNEKRDC